MTTRVSSLTECLPSITWVLFSCIVINEPQILENRTITLIGGSLVCVYVCVY